MMKEGQAVRVDVKHVPTTSQKYDTIRRHSDSCLSYLVQHGVFFFAPFLIHSVGVTMIWFNR